MERPNVTTVLFCLLLLLISVVCSGTVLSSLYPYGPPTFVEVYTFNSSDIVFVGLGGVLLIKDISNSAEYTYFFPRRVVTATYDDSQARLFVGIEGGRVFIYNATDLSNATYITYFEVPGSVRNIIPYGNLLYINSGSAGLLKVDFSDPTNVRIVRQTFFDGMISRLRLWKNKYLLVSDLSGIKLFDLNNDSDLNNPTYLVSYKNVVDFDVLNDTENVLYVLTGSEILTYEVSDSLSNSSLISKIDLVDKYKKIEVYESENLVLSNFSNKVELFEILSSGLYHLESLPYKDLACGNAYCYGLTDKTFKLVVLYPYEEVASRVYDSLRDLAFYNNSYFLAFGKGQLHILNGSFENCSYYNVTLESADALAIDRDNAVLFVGGTNGLMSLNITDPCSPSVIAGPIELSSARKLLYDSVTSRLYVLTNSGIYIYSDSFTYLGSYTGLSEAKDFALNDTDLYLALGPLGIAHLNVSDPSNITLVDSVSYEGQSVTALNIIGGKIYAYAKCGDNVCVHVLNGTLDEEDSRVVPGMHYVKSGVLYGDRLYLYGDGISVLSYPGLSWIEKIGDEKVERIIDANGSLVVGYKKIGLLKLGSSVDSCGIAPYCFDNESCSSSGFMWCGSVCKQFGCYPSTLTIEVAYNATDILGLLNGTEGNYEIVFGCVDDRGVLESSYWSISDTEWGPFAYLKVTYEDGKNEVWGSSDRISWEKLTFSHDLDGTLYCYYEENGLLVRSDKSYFISLVPLQETTPAGVSGGGGAGTVEQSQPPTIEEILADLENVVSDIKEGDVSQGTVSGFSETVESVAEAISSSIEAGQLSKQQVISFVETLPDVVEAADVIVEKTGGLPADKIDKLLKTVGRIADVIVDELDKEELQEVHTKLQRSADVVGGIVEKSDVNDVVNMSEGIGEVAKSLVVFSVDADTAVGSVDRAVELVSKVSSKAVKEVGDKGFVEMTSKAIPSYSPVVKASLKKAKELGDMRIREVLDGKLQESFSQIGSDIKSKAYSIAGEITVEDTKKVAKSVSKAVEGFFEEGEGVSQKVIVGLRRVSEGLLEGIKDDLGISSDANSNLRSYLTFKAFKATGISFSEYLRAEQQIQYVVPSVDPKKPVVWQDGKGLSTRSVLKEGLKDSGIEGDLGERKEQVVVYPAGDKDITFRIDDVGVFPIGGSKSVVLMPNGKVLVKKGDLGFVISPAPADVEAVVNTLKGVVSQGGNLKIGSDGTIDLELNALKLKAVFSYLVSKTPGGFAQGFVTFTVVGGDPASLAYRVVAVYPDDTQQSVPPYPAASDVLFDFLDAIVPDQWSFDTESGVLTLAGVGSFKVDYKVESLSPNELSWFEANKDPNYGLAFKAEDVNGDGVVDVWVYSDEGKQLFWGVK